jgi:hypothetical protein
MVATPVVAWIGLLLVEDALLLLLVAEPLAVAVVFKRTIPPSTVDGVV